MAQFFNLQKQSMIIHDKYTTGKNENKITVTLSRNEINACRHILCSGSIPPNTQEKVVEVFLQVKRYGSLRLSKRASNVCSRV
jgi:hypothetical protein